jgi:hypothetical protein
MADARAIAKGTLPPGETVMGEAREGSRKKPLTTQAIAQRIMAERSLDTANLRLLKTMTKRAGACLRNLQQQGAVTRQPGPGQFMLWELRH